MSDLHAKVTEWLGKQGFPLEFRTAEVFAKQGFETEQGAYVRDPKADVLREIDVIASSKHEVGGRTYRYAVIAECKWSHDRQWVIFTSRRARPNPTATTAYQLGSSFAEAILWYLSGDRQIVESHRNMMPLRVGFGGRQAFSQKDDKEMFYPAIQGVVAASVAFARSNDVNPSSTFDIVRECRVVAPTIVVDGFLFEAFLDGEHLKVEPLDATVVAWRGFEVRQQPTFVNIVTVPALAAYAERQAAYGENLRYWAARVGDPIAKAVVSKDGRDLPSDAPHPTGIVVPWLLKGMVG